MLKRLIINDFKANKIITISTSAFMAVTAMLLGLAILLFARLYTSIDSLMKKAETPSFLQMHTGELDEEKLNDFTRARSDVEKMQVCNFLNLQNSQISIGGRSFEGNMQDNGLCCQSESFDYLLDADGTVIEVLPGEVYVPVCYKNEYDIKITDEMRIGTETLTVAGFLRDSQMNSMMASSKRFLVCGSDYERIRSLGSEEYLIEFRLKDGSDVNAFATAYKDSGLPDNGPTITYPLIKTMNALSDGIMILVILLVSVVVLFISILCIRYIILTQMEKDRREIGMLKAVGISRKDIRNLYMSKYLILSAIGCLVGIVTALFIAKPLGEGMRELYGEAENAALVYILMFIGAILAEVIILLSVRRTLRKTEKESAVSALCGRDGSGKKKNLWVSVMIVVAAAAFMIIVPQSMKTTLGNPEFVTYMGIGNSQIRMDVRQTEDIDKVTENLAAEIEQDERVDSYSVMQTGSYKVTLANGNSYNLMIECGDHGRFPVNYIKGSYPKSENDIALSILNAEDMGLDVGDMLVVSKDTGNGSSEQYTCTVCGIYSDITNGGKTAKGCIRDENDRTPIMWSVIYISLKDAELAGDWVNEYRSRYSSFDEGIKATEISDYLKGVYGQTIENISNAYVVALILANFIIIIVVVLLVRLIIWRERKDSSLKKALGLKTSDIRKEYLKKAFLYIIPGIVIGVVFGVIPGQKMTGVLLGSFGAQGFQFVINPLLTFVFVPVLTIASAGFAAALSLIEIKRIKSCECLNSGTE